MKYLTEDNMRAMLKQRLRKKSKTELAQEIGISPQMLSMLLNPRYPFTGKAVAWLGCEKVRESLFVVNPTRI